MVERVAGRRTSAVRHALEVLTSVLLTIAAAALLWRLYEGGAPRPPTSRPSAQPVEALEPGLTTTLSGLPRKGNERARIALIEFSDFQCPFCARHALETFEKLHAAFVETGDVQYAIRDFPLEQRHPLAVRAAMAAACAGNQESFWEMRRALFREQSGLSSNVWTREALGLGLDISVFNQCLDDASPKRIHIDIAEGRRLGIKSTPTFLIGELSGTGEVRLLSRIRGAQPYEIFEQSLRVALRESSSP